MHPKAVASLAQPTLLRAWGLFLTPSEGRTDKAETQISPEALEFSDGLTGQVSYRVVIDNHLHWARWQPSSRASKGGSKSKEVGASYETADPRVDHAIGARGITIELLEAALADGEIQRAFTGRALATTGDARKAFELGGAKLGPNPLGDFPYLAGKLYGHAANAGACAQGTSSLLGKSPPALTSRPSEAP